jgi:hypothetical protein
VEAATAENQVRLPAPLDLPVGEDDIRESFDLTFQAREDVAPILIEHLKVEAAGVITEEPVDIHDVVQNWRREIFHTDLQAAQEFVRENLTPGMDDLHELGNSFLWPAVCQHWSEQGYQTLLLNGGNADDAIATLEEEAHEVYHEIEARVLTEPNIRGIRASAAWWRINMRALMRKALDKNQTELGMLGGNEHLAHLVVDNLNALGAIDDEAREDMKRIISGERFPEPTEAVPASDEATAEAVLQLARTLGVDLAGVSTPRTKTKSKAKKKAQKKRAKKKGAVKKKIDNTADGPLVTPVTAERRQNALTLLQKIREGTLIPTMRPNTPRNAWTAGPNRHASSATPWRQMLQPARLMTS